MLYSNSAFIRKTGQFGIAFVVISITLLLENSEVSAANLPITDIKDLDTFAGETVSRVGRCYNDSTLIEIRFNFAYNIAPLISICHDESTDFTYWSQDYIYGALLRNEDGGPRPSFKKSDFYPSISAEACYTQKKQNETIGMLLGSTQLAQQYIQPTKNLFLARGHLTPNGDQITDAEKQATFYFINASPQWQTINGGNWEALERKLRDIASASRSILTVWTGSYGIMKLDDVNGNPVEIWLGRDSNDGKLVRKLPVNQLTWKVIHDPATRTGVAVIQVNNPWMKSVQDSDILCDDVCDKLDWITWNTTDIVHGYTYCCTVQSFREKVQYAPNLGDLPLFRSKASTGATGGIVNTALVCISLIAWAFASNSC